MAHIIFATQGIKNKVDEFVNDLQAQYFPWDWTAKNICVCGQEKENHDDSKCYKDLVCECGQPIWNHNPEKCNLKEIKPIYKKENFIGKFTPATKPMAVQGALRPVQLWMYVVPEPSLGEAIKTLGIENPNKNEWSAKALMLRKALNAKPLPKVDENIQPRRIRKAGVSIIPIGVRSDEFGDIPGYEGIFTGERL